MDRRILKVLIVAFACILIPVAQAVIRHTDDATPAGAVISNRAEGTYLNEDGEQISTVSETVTLIVASVSGLSVTPDDDAPSATFSPHERAVKLFQVCNTGNTPSAFTLSQAEVSTPATLAALHFDLDGSGTLTAGDTPIVIGQTNSPSLPAGACAGVLTEVDINATPAKSLVTLRLTAVSVSDGNVIEAAQDQGTLIYGIGTGPSFTSVENPSEPPSLLIDRKRRITATPGQTLTYTLTFANTGDASAQAVVVTDDLPEKLEYLPGSLTLSLRYLTGEEAAHTGRVTGQPLSGLRHLTDAEDTDEGRIIGRQLVVRLKEVAPGEMVEISFQVRLSGLLLPGAGVPNHAVLSAANIRAVRTSSDALVVSNQLGVIYAGDSGGAVKVSGATVTLSTDQPGENPLLLAPNTDTPTAESNKNPLITGAQGEFDFALSPSQLGTVAQPVTYFINVTAAGFHRRLLEATLHPLGSDLFALTVRAIDEQPLAQGGSFILTNEAIQLDQLAAIVLNIPVFESSTFEITKMADKQRAEIGEVVSYRIEARNAMASPITGIIVRDRLPASFHYAPGTARVESRAGLSRAIEPEIAGNEMLFRPDQLDSGEGFKIIYRVRIGANAAQGEQFNSARAEGVLLSNKRVSSALARSGVVVGHGIFGMQQAIIGRVFEDLNGNGQFDKGERPVKEARLYLSNGDLVITDSEGMYNFPLVREGALVISLDPVSLPSGYQLLDDNLRAGRSWTRLLRTPLGGGSLLRQNFALRAPLGQDEEGRAKAGPKSVEASPLAPSIPAQKTSRAAGTYELEATDDVVPVAPGAVRIDSPAPGQVIFSAAMRLEATVAEGWTVAVEVGGEKISDTLIGERRVDHKNKVSSYTYIGLNVRPGPNQVKATAISPEGQMGSTTELSLFGRGPARRLEIVPHKKELAAGGRDSTLVRVRAYDQWNHPAGDDQVIVEVSTGSLRSDACAQAGTASDCRPANNLPTQQSFAQKDNLALLAQAGATGSSRASEPSDTSLRQRQLSLINGEARIWLVAGNAPGNVELRALMGQIETRAALRILPEMRPTILVALAEASIGRAAPDRNWQGTRGNTSSRLSFFYRGRIFDKNLLTLSYDTHRPLHRVAGRDRLFQLDPRERVYPIFGDSSTRFEEAQSNSKLYARLDRGPSFLLFGDFNPDKDGAHDTSQPGQTASRPGSSLNAARMLTGYSRNLTGLKLHLENAQGDTLTLTGARPETAFARDVFPGGYFGLLQLTQPGVLPGSENIVLEVRDRRNPEIIISRTPLARSVDYNLDVDTGSIFLLRPISSFDYALNLLQVVVTYEYFARNLSSAVYTARASKHFTSAGLRVGLSLINQRQAEFGPFYLGGVDLEKSLPRGGSLQLEWGMSQGRVAAAGNLFNFAAGDGQHNGHAYRVDLFQPLPFYEAVLRANFARADAGFLNPFGATVAPGSQRASAMVDMKLRPTSKLRVALMHERNATANVNNQRLTAGIGWSEQVTDRLQVNAAYDFRSFVEGKGGRDITSHLFTLGAEWRPYDKLSLGIKREQNLGDADPTYPTQTLLTASYQVNPLTRLFFTQRLASAPIVPISDESATGFASSTARREMAFGVETRLGRYTNFNSRYQLENGINGSDSFAVIGLVNQLPLNSKLSLDVGVERGQHLAGEGTSFTSGSVGFSWLPTKNFRSSARYELRDRAGFGQILTLGAAGKVGDDITMLASFQGSRSKVAGRESSTTSGTAALAYRPLHSDRAALLFSFNRRSLTQDGGPGAGLTRERSDTLSTDGLFRLKMEMEFYGRFALKFNEDGRGDLARVSTLTYLAQTRLQHRFASRYDAAVEWRWLAQPSTGTRRTSMGAELGLWVMPDLRVGAGYNFIGVREPQGNLAAGPGRSGFYFTISSKISHLFNLFGTSQNGLTASGTPAPDDWKKKQE